MRAAISLMLLLLFSMCGVRARSTQTEVQPESQGTGSAAAAAEVSTQLDVSAELKELRDMVVEQRVILQSTQEDLKTLEAENTELRERVVASEIKVGILETVNADQETELTAVRERLVTSETKVAALETVTAETEAEVETLKGGITAAIPKVAFTAGLGDYPVENVDEYMLDLVFKNIVTNVGGGYNNQTGVFTAPVKGVYYFRYTAMDYFQPGYMEIFTRLNGELAMVSSEYDDNGKSIHGSNGYTLHLEEGDRVHLQLLQGSRIYDNGFHYSHFSGFLLFPL